MATIKKLIEMQNELLEKLEKEQTAHTDSLFLRLDRMYDLLLELMKPTMKPTPDEPEMEKEADLFSQAEEQPEKRSRKDIKDEAFARNLISLDALRIRYGVSKDTINAAARYLGLKLHAIEGSECKYIDRSKIGEITDYLTKA